VWHAKFSRIRSPMPHLRSGEVTYQDACQITRTPPALFSLIHILECIWHWIRGLQVESEMVTYLSLPLPAAEHGSWSSQVICGDRSTIDHRTSSPMIRHTPRDGGMILPVAFCVKIKSNTKDNTKKASRTGWFCLFFFGYHDLPPYTSKLWWLFYGDCLSEGKIDW